MKRFNHFLLVVTLLSLITVKIPSTYTQSSDIDAILSRMTLEQKVAQMFMVSFFSYPPNQSAIELFETMQPGAVVLLPSNLTTPDEITQLTNTLQETVINVGGLPLLIAVDQEGGEVARLQDGFTEFPVPMLWTATQNTEIAYDIGEALATELLAVGINMNLAPVADLLTNPNNTVVNRRVMGSYAKWVNPMLGAVIDGMQSNGVVATVKHFPGHGSTDVDSHLGLPIVQKDVDQLFIDDLAPFAEASEQGVGAMMTSHVVYPNIDTDVTRPTSLSPIMIQDVLRTQVGYDGIVITDALDMDAIDTRYTQNEAVLQAILAGNDMVIMGVSINPDVYRSAVETIVQAINEGMLTESRIDESVRRILQTKSDYGILDWQPFDPTTVNERLPLDEHEALVRQVFEEGITLVQGGEQFPLTGSIGLVYSGARPSIGRFCESFVSDEQELVRYAITLDPDDQAIATVSLLAERVDTIIVMTQNVHRFSQQIELVKQLPPEKTIIVAMYSPYDINYIEDAGGIVENYVVVYSPLVIGHEPLCDVLMNGRPQGTLPIDLFRDGFVP